MKLGAALTLVGLGVGIATFAVATGCSSESETGTVNETGKTIPEETGTPAAATEERVFALNSLSLGEADRGGNKNKDAWKKYGFNLDNRITAVADKSSPGLGRVCKLQPGAVASTHQDGDEGTDNSFGKNILTLLDPFAPNPSTDISKSIIDGEFTIMLKVIGLTDEPEQTNTGLSGTLLVGGAFNPEDKTARPTFTAADDWPYVADPQVPISGAYINKGVFVNGKGGAQVKIAIGIQGQNLNLTINKAIISFKHNPATKSLEEGTIAGVINTEELVTGVGAIAGRLSKDLCQGSTVEGIKSSLKQASDMLADGTQDPGRTCDGISVGLGFTAKQIGKPTKIAPATGGGDDPCAPGSGDQDGGT
jgi:hypothetical protein